MDKHSNIQKTALSVTRWVGSPTSIVTHTVVFIASFLAVSFGLLSFDRMLLVLTTIVSLEAIYLAIFIQMTINYQTEAIAGVEHDIDEIQEDVHEMGEDLGEIQEDVEEISEDVDELQENVEEITEDVEEMTEEEQAEATRKSEQRNALSAIQKDIQRLLNDVERLKGSQSG